MSEINHPFTFSRSQQLYTKAQNLIAGGVNSPVRSFTAVNQPHPLFIKRAQGSHIFDVDDNRYIDYVNCWGANLLGHADYDMTHAIEQALKTGLGFGAPTEIENDFAQLICERFKSIELCRAVNSGTEATMSAIRLARGYTERNKIIKFIGCYHGHSDLLLVKAGSGVSQLAQTSSAGVPANAIADTLVCQYNDHQALLQLSQNHQDDLAAIILEPIAGNMNLIEPSAQFLQTLELVRKQTGCLLIYDEVMTGLRVHHTGGAQELQQITPDLTCLGKIIGGGLPVGAFGGKKEIMQKLAPLGPVYQAGTLSGNPITMQAGVSTLEKISTINAQQIAANQAKCLATAINELATSAPIAISAKSCGAMLGIYMQETAPTNFDEVAASDTDAYNKLFANLLTQGIYIAPSKFEACFLSAAHSNIDIDQSLTALKHSLDNWS